MKTMRIIVFYAVLAIIVYAVGILIGLIWAPPTVPTCDGQVMSRLDTCGRAYSVGGTPHNIEGYDEKLGNQQLDHQFYVYLIAFFLAIASPLFILAKYNKYKYILMKLLGEKPTTEKDAP